MKNTKYTGGVVPITQMETKTAFNNFIENSDITLLPVKTGSGFIFVSTLKPDVPSLYKNIRKSIFSKKVDKIIIKLVAISPDYEGSKKTWTSSIATKDIEKRSGFDNECDIQTEVFEKTKYNSDPICPAIIYSSVVENESDSIDFLEKMVNVASIDARDILNEIQENIKNKTIPSLGILAMEMADGYKSLSEMYSKEDSEIIKRMETMARLRILQMAIYTGYSIHDFNTGNILVNPDITGYYKDIPGHVIIIDFGAAEKLDDDTLSKIRRHYDSGNYVAALTVFKDLVRKDGAKLNYFEIHGWLYYRFNKKVQKSCKKGKFTPLRISNAHGTVASAPINRPTLADLSVQRCKKMGKELRRPSSAAILSYNTKINDLKVAEELMISEATDKSEARDQDTETKSKKSSSRKKGKKSVRSTRRSLVAK